MISETQKRYGDVVAINYRGCLRDGTVFDDHSSGEPLEVMLGAHELPLGVEGALLEMLVGEERILHLPPEQAFGPIDAEGIMRLPRFAVPNAHQLEAGMTISWHAPQAPKTQVLVRVVAVDATTVTLDFNHPLAGEEVEYWLKLVAVNKE
jgi:FKBP-type peptidyl-prolyl cis-trans isomerase 2